MKLLAIGLAGLIGAGAFAPLGWWPLIFVSIAIFVHLLRDQQIGAAAALGFVYGLAFFLPVLHWSGSYVGALPWIALSALQAAFFIPLGIAVSKVSSAWLIGSIWLAMEALRSRIPWGGFGWARAAFSQADSPTLALASLGGAALLSFFIAVLSAGIALRQRSALLILLLLPLAWAQPTSDGPALKVAAVQGNVPRLGLDFNSQREAVLDNHLNALAKIPPSSVDLVILPENASDVDPYSVREKIQAGVDRVDAPVIIGGVPVVNGRLFNSSILWLPRTGVASVYNKQHLAPFGEYMPLRGLAETLVPEAKRVVDFSPGQELVVHSIDATDIGSVKVGTIICFEVLYDGLVRQNVTKGAQLLSVQTNSATFGRSSESAQQLAITRLRAVEHARSIVSVSTSGISALIAPNGDVLSRSGFFEERLLIDSLPLSKRLTLSDRLGEWTETGLVALPVLLGLTRRKLSSRERVP